VPGVIGLTLPDAGRGVFLPIQKGEPLDLAGQGLWRCVAVQADEAGDPAHPLSLIRRVLERAPVDGLDRLGSWQLGRLAEADHLARGRREWPPERPGGLRLHAELEHLARAGRDPSSEDVLRYLDAEDERGEAKLVAPKTIVRRGERLPDLGELEGSYDAPPVVRVDSFGGERVALCEKGMRMVGAHAVVDALETSAPGAGAGGTARTASPARR
jgi:hypothetical protein